MSVKVIPKFDFSKYDLGIGFILHRENESKKYIRDKVYINYVIGIVLLWFSFGFEIRMVRK